MHIAVSVNIEFTILVENEILENYIMSHYN